MAMAADDLSDEAWRLLTVLLRLGRPVLAADLAIGCTPGFVEFLCRIPGSPLLLTRDRRVTLSRTALLAFLRFVSQAISSSSFVPVPDGSVFWSRKRKTTELLAPDAKRRTRRRRSLLLLTSGNESSEADGDSSLSNGIHANHAAAVVTRFNASNSGFSFSVDASLYYGLMMFKQYVTMSTLLHNDVLLSNDIWSNVKHDKRGRVVGIRNDNTKSVIVHRHLLHLSDSEKEYCSLGTGTKSAIILPEGKGMESILVSKPDVVSEFPESITCPFVILETFGEEKYTQATCNAMLANDMNLNETAQEANNDAGIAVNLCQDAIKRRTSDDAMPTIEIHHPYKQDAFDSGHAELGSSFVSALPDQATTRIEAIINPSKHSTAQKLLVETQTGSLFASSIGLQASSRDSKNKKNVNHEKQQNAKGNLKYARKKIRSRNVLSNEIESGFVSKAEKNPVETKKLPHFDTFVVEEEEGSGGYGTVYRARRNTDGKTFAIKCPHPKAHSYHVNNELKMLEQFGGRSFVIKFEGSFRSGNSECFILEHVKHDRPEILKKVIDITELQWYGYCMFKALVSLHKQEIVHRDVKPGNFLFSRELNKGYLIDFNLAMDLHHKHRSNSRSGINPKGDLLQSVAHSQPTSPVHSRKSLSHKRMEVDKNVNKDSNKTFSPKNATKKERDGARGFLDCDSRNKCGSQAADASGLTSAKDVTSTRTPSAERSRVPILWNVRKELKSLVQEVMQSSNQKTLSAPTSQRKRIAAPVGKVERMLASLTPMPLYSNGVAISNTGMLKNKGDGKHKTEGPCVGTKGFRAPEVLLKSLHQGCKVDTWSAGVTLLYLMIGRTPFGGDPEQNIKEIAKLRGSEVLWEVAKLHNRESSFPMELFDIQSMQSMELKSWCQKNTKRPEFLEKIPHTLFDLIDKCLTVNPRQRISSEEALMHDFFSPCRESLRKQRHLRLSRSSQAGSQVEKERSINA